MRTKILIDVFDKLPFKAKELLLSEENFEMLSDIALNLYYTESPIELILYTALIKLFKETNLTLYIGSQTEIKCKNGKKYRADFTIVYDDILNKTLKEDFALVIECDGYEFHQKTKEQVKKDNEREYNLKIEGYDVLRFSGTQIYQDPMKCANDIINYILEKNK